MNTDNPFGEEIDDDGLPKYSPDRKNIVAYHMYKLGMTDKLPDPEESHTPFFRTPSYYEEKAQRQRQEQAGLSPRFEVEPGRIEPVKPESSDFFRKYPIRGNEPDFDKPAFRVPSTGQKLFVPDTNAPYGQMGQAGQKEKEVAFGQQEGKGQNKEDSSSDGNAFGREVLGRIFGGMKPVVPNGGLDGGLQKQPSSGSDMTGALQPDQAKAVQPVWPKVENVPDLPDRPEEVSPSIMDNPPARMDKAFVLPGQTVEKANAYLSGDGEMKGIQNLLYVPDKEEVDNGFGKPSAYHTAEWIPGQHDSNEDRWRSDIFPLWIFSPEETGRERLLDGAIETASLTGMEALPIQNAVYPIKEEVQVDHDADVENGTAPGWTNGDTSQTDSQQKAGAAPDGDFSVDGLEAPSAGNARQSVRRRHTGTMNKPVKTVFTTANPDNPDFTPAKIAYVDISQYPIMDGRYLVSEDMANGINRDLTKTNMGYPIGINFRFLSALEGGSGHSANIPLNRSDAENNKDLGNRSGVTVGSGFDLGQVAKGAAGEATLRGYGFPESLVQKLSPYLGKKRLDAFFELDKRPLVLNDNELDLINRQVMTRYGNKCIVQWDSAVEKLREAGLKTPYFHEMNSAQQTLIFSRYYHQGPGWQAKNKAIYGSMVKNDWGTVKVQLQVTVKRLDKSGPKWKHTRFNNELKFLKESN